MKVISGSMWDEIRTDKEPERRTNSGIEVKLLFVIASRTARRRIIFGFGNPRAKTARKNIPTEISHSRATVISGHGPKSTRTPLFFSSLRFTCSRAGGQSLLA